MMVFTLNNVQEKKTLKGVVSHGSWLLGERSKFFAFQLWTAFERLIAFWGQEHGCLVGWINGQESVQFIQNEAKGKERATGYLGIKMLTYLWGRVLNWLFTIFTKHRSYRAIILDQIMINCGGYESWSLNQLCVSFMANFSIPKNQFCYSE